MIVELRPSVPHWPLARGRLLHHGNLLLHSWQERASEKEEGVGGSMHEPGGGRDRQQDGVTVF